MCLALAHSQSAFAECKQYSHSHQALALYLLIIHFLSSSGCQTAHHDYKDNCREQYEVKSAWCGSFEYSRSVQEDCRSAILK